jgi:hypothetical protein
MDRLTRRRTQRPPSETLQEALTAQEQEKKFQALQRIEK